MPKPVGKPVRKGTALSPSHFGKRDARRGQFVTAGPATSESMPGAGFLAKTKLKKAGGSLVMTMPASARNLLHLTEGQEMTVTVQGKKVILEPVPKVATPMRIRPPKYTLDELVAGMDPDAPRSEEERAWMDEPPVGREVW